MSAAGGASPVRAVLFDFSGTLFRFTERDEWFAGMHDAAGRPIDGHLQSELIRRMTAPTGVPEGLDEPTRQAWLRRDVDPDMHRRAYLAVLRAAGLDGPGHAESLYGRILSAESWDIYPDTVEVLTALHEQGIGVGVVSNIAFDLRPVFARHGVAHLVGAWALSHEVGVTKPDAGIFRYALHALGIPPAAAVMIGDSAEADGGAAALGCEVVLVDACPVAERPTAMLDALVARGLIAGR